MKKLSQIKILGGVIVLVLLLNACNKKTEVTPSSSCVMETANESTSASTYLASNGQLLALFNFSQVENSFTNITCGQSSYGATSLTITNATSLPVSFTYVITVTVGIVTWQYQGAVAIAGSSSIDVGVINSTNAQRVHLGSISIQLYNITI
jgi:hypothetical protein